MNVLISRPRFDEGNVAEWFERWTRNSEIRSSSPALTASYK